MNLIEDEWLPVIRSCGKEDIIAPWQIAESDNPVIEINAPRPDFQGALYQFLIGLLQTSFAPEDHDEWLDYWEEMPDVDVLKNRFMTVSSAFDLDNSDGPAFMQDFSGFERLLEAVKCSGSKTKNNIDCMSPIRDLLIDAPKDNTLKLNKDFFVKREKVQSICKACSAMALFTLQINSPDGGQGHRAGVRKGGPLTTIVLPESDKKNEKRVHLLWHRLWSNILPSENNECPIKNMPNVFPWLSKTRTSGEGEFITTPLDVNVLQFYWPMPRRIFLDWTNLTTGDCDICKAKDTTLISTYVTKNHGVKYSNEWLHSLSPYYFSKDKTKPPRAVTGKQGGLSYQHWLGLVMGNRKKSEIPAKTVTDFLAEKRFLINSSTIPTLWCFGFDMESNKARCWYDHTMPLFRLDLAQQKNVMDWASEFIDSARFIADNLRKQVKAAWFRRPKDVKGDMSAVSQSFWQQSEAAFYSTLEGLSKLPGTQRQAPPEIYHQWLKVIQRLAISLFDEWALESSAEDLDMKRIIAAREGLKKQIYSSKTMKILSAKAKPEKEDKK